MDKKILVIFEHKITFFSYLEHKFLITNIYQNSKLNPNRSKNLIQISN